MIAYSDDHGKTFSSSGALHQDGLDEGSIAQLPNGSLITIFRNCFEPGGKGCQGQSRDTTAVLPSFNDSSRGVGGKRFYVSFSEDGGETTGTSVAVFPH